MTDPVTAVVLGVVEGITEFLPVSSTGHLLIAQQWLPRQTDLFNVVIQTGAVLAVIPLFHKRFHQFIFNWRDPVVHDYFVKIVAAFFITGVGGFIMEKRGFKLPEKLLPIAIALLVGGVLFLIVERWLARTGHGAGKDKESGDLRNVTWTVAIAVGIGQLIAAGFPGASRSGTTIIFALLLGLTRPLATEYSFLVSIPTMLAAGGYKIFEAMHHPKADAPHENWHMVILASVIAAVVSFIAVKWLLRYVQTHTFVLFGWYRVLIGGALLVALAMKLI
ncbi:MAG TPA: undecaprenyl-diphosphate phosphatase [Candidatus Baltobacteraceae bacterium]|jgi:undecaprenyl-diphosphatase|nr:undecaprenyl-diphosphate phosphatase [Candidatus Baltobacteraceae bacterium]